MERHGYACAHVHTHTHTHTQRKEHHVKMQAETEVMLPQAKQCQALLATPRSWKKQRRIVP